MILISVGRELLTKQGMFGMYSEIFFMNMIVCVCCFIFLGIFVGGASAILYVNFDKDVKKLLFAILGAGGSWGLITYFHNQFEISDGIQKMVTWVAFIPSLIISFCFVLFIICKLMRDKDDADVLRIRDILLGQKDYVAKYYEWRKKQIDEKLQISKLEEREKKVSNRENACQGEEKRLLELRNSLKKQSRNKLCLLLPENKIVALNQEFVNELPAYLEGFSHCINGIEYYFDEEKKKIEEGEDVTKESFSALLMNIVVCILSSVFDNSSQIRIHFRYYNLQSGFYEMLVAITGKNTHPDIISNMTPIPYKESMIEKSYYCKRAVIRSLNPNATKYDGKNRAVWRDYMTYSFYNITIKNNEGVEVPALTFGISVKNEERYKNLFRFLNFAKLEDYINNSIDSYNDIAHIKDILYAERELKVNTTKTHE